MLVDLGIVKPGSTHRVPWGSYDGASGASEAASGFADADILVYKDGSTTQVAGGSCGCTATTSFDSGDGLVGINVITINLANNTTAGHWASGSEYLFIVGPVTVDGQTLYFPAVRLIIGQPAAILNTTIASVSTQTSFTLTAGPAEADALNGCKLYLHDVASAVQGCFVIVLDYAITTKTVTLVSAPTFTIAATDHVAVFEPTDVERIVTDIIAQVATAQELVDAMDNDSTQLENISASSASLADKMGWLFVSYSAVIGATGNDTTHLHLPTMDAYLNDDLNNLLLAVYDDSTGLTYSRWIEAWSSTGDLATVATLPFTPEPSVDLFAILSTRRDVTVAAGLNAAGVRTAVGLGSANMDTQFTGITNRLSPLVTKTGLVVADGGNSATSFKTNLTAITTNHYKDAFLRITSGSLIEQVKKCTGSTGTTDVVLQFASGFTGTPADSVTFEIVND